MQNKRFPKQINPNQPRSAHTSLYQPRSAQLSPNQPKSTQISSDLAWSRTLGRCIYMENASLQTLCYAMLCSMVWLGLTWVNLGWFALIWGTLNRQTHFWSTLQSTVSINFQRKIEFVKGVLSEPWSHLGTSHREPCEKHGFLSMVLRSPRSGVSWNSSNSLSESYFSWKSG